jgi:hypothetical protein
MINENQHKILALPAVQELIKTFDLEHHDSSREQTRLVANRVSAWIDKIEITPRIISTDAPVNNPFLDKTPWIRQQIAMHGINWCPFVLIIALMASYCVDAYMRHPVDSPPCLGWKGKSIPADRGPELLFF